MHLLFSAYLIFFIAARQKIGHFNAILQFLFVLSLFVPFYTSKFLFWSTHFRFFG